MHPKSDRKSKFRVFALVTLVLVGIDYPIRVPHFGLSLVVVVHSTSVSPLKILLFASFDPICLKKERKVHTSSQGSLPLS